MFVAALPTEASEPSAFPRRQANAPSMDEFLDRLMMAESGGRREARNARSSALGPFQFISSTFLDVMRRNLAAEIEGLSEAKVLDMRTDPDVSRKAARVYVSESRAILDDNGLPASWVNLRLAFLVGARGAIRVLQAPGETPLAEILGGQALWANPFMTSMRVSDLIRKAAIDIGATHAEAPTPGAPLAATRPEPPIEIRCKLGLASCRRWLALQQRKHPGALPVRAAAATITAPR
jgi:hypothetical protein